MTVLLLIRHAVTDQTGKRLYGRTPGILLSEEGRAQARRLGERLGEVAFAAVYTSPLERCMETARAITNGRGMKPRVARDLLEVDYGDWTGRSFPTLRRTKMWARVHAAPSGVRFPSGESLVEVQRRAVALLDGLAVRHPRTAVAVVSHGDVVRLSLAHYAGVHIDLFQRLAVEPASVSAIALGEDGPRILRINDTGAVRDVVGG